MKQTQNDAPRKQSTLMQPIRNQKNWEEKKAEKPKEKPEPQVVERKETEKHEFTLSSSYQPPRAGKDQLYEEDALLIEQMLEEDDSWLVARRIQDAAFDGVTHPNPSDKSHRARVLTDMPIRNPILSSSKTVEEMTEDEQIYIAMQLSREGHDC